MRAFARLLDSLVYTQSRNRKVALLGHYFRTAPDPDRGWALAALTDGVPIRIPLRRMLSDLVSRFVDPVLYRLSRDYVGDTAETVSLLWPDDRVVVATSDVPEAQPAPDNDDREKPKQLVLDLTPTPRLSPTPGPSPQGGGESSERRVIPRSSRDDGAASTTTAPSAADEPDGGLTSPSSRVRGEGWGEERQQTPEQSAAPRPDPLPVKDGERKNGNSPQPSTDRDDHEASTTNAPSAADEPGGGLTSSSSRVRGEGWDEERQQTPEQTAAPYPVPLPVKDGERENGNSLLPSTDRDDREASTAHTDPAADEYSGSAPTSPLPLTGRGRGWGEAGHNSGEPPELALGAVIEAMADGTTAQRTERLGHLLDQLDATGRWALLKLIGGAPRVGVSARLARTALAECYGRDVSEIEEIWHALTPPYLDLFQWLDGKAERPDPGSKPVFRPVMLAHPIEEEDWPRLSPEDFSAEWKWDGIRVQIAARGGEVKMFSRQGDDISGAFPEIRSAFQGHDCVVDGELLVMRDGEIAPFNDLQQRLNRKTVTAKMMQMYPPHVRLYDLLFDGHEDLRGLSFADRRARLEAWHAKHHPRLTDVSPLVAFKTFEELGELWASARAEGIEGLMLKRRASVYQAGRVKGEWFKWKRAALTLDCVLMYAQRGSGKRSSYYSDYTFGVWKTDDNGETQLVPVGKAYSGFTDEELLELDKWIRGHTTEAFGPVRAVEPQLVFEVAFDAVQPSTRHKSGVAMRFPRIHRIRWDKPAAEADTLESVLRLIGGATAATSAEQSRLA